MEQAGRKTTSHWKQQEEKRKIGVKKRGKRTGKKQMRVVPKVGKKEMRKQRAVLVGKKGTTKMAGRIEKKRTKRIEKRAALVEKKAALVEKRPALMEKRTKPAMRIEKN